MCEWGNCVCQSSCKSCVQLKRGSAADKCMLHVRMQFSSSSAYNDSFDIRPVSCLILSDGSQSKKLQC